MARTPLDLAEPARRGHGQHQLSRNGGPGSSRTATSARSARRPPTRWWPVSGAVVLPGIRVVDGLRGVLDLADSRVLARNRQNRADNEESVALGLARTGRVVTAAALLMAVTFASLVPPTCRSCGFSASECARGAGGRHAGSDVVDAGLHACARPGELVGAGTVGAAAPAVRHQRIFCRGRGFSAITPRKRSGCHGCGEPCRGMFAAG